MPLLALLLATPHALFAQQEPPAEPEPDSAQERIRERLRRLARPIGSDSVLFVEDSIRQAEAQQGPPPMSTDGDSIVARLSGMPGYTLTRYEGGAADFTARERVLVLRAPPEGRATVAREGLRVEADSSITFDETSGRMRTRGTATFTPPGGDPVTSEDMVYDLDEGRGTARAARTEFSEGGTRWFMTGDMPWAAQDSTFLSHAHFTTCDLEEPHYHFETDEIKVVGGRLLVARGVRLYFADVPVAWLPFMAQSLEQGRASGLLTPSFSVNDIVRSSSGYRRRISNLGFYWAMSDYSDAAVSMDWFSGAFFSLTGDFQYRVNRQFLDGRASVRRFWREEGGGEFAIDTDHRWEPDERTSLSANASFTSDTDLVTDYSVDPRETTRDIRSTAGLNRRFDWGNLSATATRAQYLSDGRVEWTLPQASLSLSSRTLFPAPTSEAHVFNNITWRANTGFSRTTMNRPEPELFAFGLADTETRSANLGTSFGIGNLSVGPAVRFSERITEGVPLALLENDGEPLDPAELLAGVPSRDIAQANLSLNASVSYQQRLIGSTTVTPNLTVSRDMLRSDTSMVAQSFVSAPTRLSLGATLRTDVYGFFPGFGSFEAVRHKISPSFQYQWSPATTPNELQRQVFGRGSLQPRNVISIDLNQTFEAKRRVDDDPADAVQPAPEPAPDSVVLVDPAAPGQDTLQGGPRRVQSAPVVKLLGLTTSIIRYDFVEADSLGLALGGFTSTTLSNQISSDYLRGLSIGVQHDLFADSVAEGALVERRFEPRLSSLNLRFSLNSRSSIVRWLGLGGGADGETPEEAAENEAELDELEDPFADDEMLGEQSMIPGAGRQTGPAAARQSQSDIGEWNASLTYSLQRPRNDPDRVSQMLSGSLSLRPTENWDVSWRTSYDLEAGAFNDHVVRLTRDLHDWEAHFDFTQTATGNWSFRFEVALTGLRDLKFDYRQRNVAVAAPGSQ